MQCLRASLRSRPLCSPPRRPSSRALCCRHPAAATAPSGAAQGRVQHSAAPSSSCTASAAGGAGPGSPVHKCECGGGVGEGEKKGKPIQIRQRCECVCVRGPDLAPSSPFPLASLSLPLPIFPQFLRPPPHLCDECDGHGPLLGRPPHPPDRHRRRLVAHRCRPVNAFALFPPASNTSTPPPRVDALSKRPRTLRRCSCILSATLICAASSSSSPSSCSYFAADGAAASPSPSSSSSPLATAAARGQLPR